MLGAWSKSFADYKSWWAVSVGGEELKWRQLAHHQLMSQQGLYFSPHSKAKANDKAQISRRMVSSGIYKSRSIRFNILGENRMKKCWIMIIIIMKKSQETTVFGGR